MKIAVLITTFEREKETKKCLKKLFENNYKLDVYISDSNSKNNIKDLSNYYSNVNIVNVGDNVFWNKGMNFSWNNALRHKEYDYYIWLNNDTYLYPYALDTIFNDLKKVGGKSIIVGTTENDYRITYGGRNSLKGDILKPNGVPQKIKYLNGNFVLIPKIVFSLVGFLNKNYTHSLGDIDYGLRAINENICLYNSSRVLGFCDDDNFIWYNQSSLYLRLKNFNSPKGTPIKEYFYFNKKHFGYFKAMKFILAVIVGILSPKLYKIISQSIK